MEISQKNSTRFEKFFLFWDRMSSLHAWNASVEMACLFMELLKNENQNTISKEILSNCDIPTVLKIGKFIFPQVVIYAGRSAIYTFATYK